MATGGGGGAGGGGFNFRLARAHVEIDVDMTRYTRGLAQAESRLGAFSSRLNLTLKSYAASLDRVEQRVQRFTARLADALTNLKGLSTASPGINRVTGAISDMATELGKAATQARRLLSALQAIKVVPRSAVNAAARSVGAGVPLPAALASPTGAAGLGAMWAQVFRDFARGSATVASAVRTHLVPALAQARQSFLGQFSPGGGGLFGAAHALASTRTGGDIYGGFLAARMQAMSAYARVKRPVLNVANTVRKVPREIMQELGAEFRDAMQVTRKVFAEIRTELGAELGDLVAKVAPGLSRVRDVFRKVSASPAVQAVWGGVRGAGSALAPAVRPMMDALQAGWSQASGGLGAALKATVGRAFSGLGTSGGVIGSAFKGVAGLATSAFSGAAKVFGSAFSLAIRGVGTLLSSVARGFSKALSVAGGVLSSALGGMSGVVGSLARGLGLAAGIGGIVGGLGVAGLAYEGAHLESRQVALQRVTGLDPKGAQALTESIRRMSVDLAGLPMEKLFGIAEMGARLGIEGSHLELFTRDIARVGQVLADIPIDEATTRIARLLAVFHQGPEAALRLASALNRLDMASTASARDILDITSRLSGPASFLGMKPQQALALATALREAGVPLETGGTAMTQIMTRMASRKDSAKFARTAGMTTGQFEATLGSDPLRAIKAFEEGLARVDRLQGPIAAVRVLDELHLDGQRVRGTILQLGRVMEQLNTYEALAAEEWQNTSSIMGGAAKMTQTLSAQWTRLMNTFRMAVQDLATNLLPLFKGAVEGGRMLIEDIDLAIRGSGDFIQGWAQWGGNLLKTLGMAVREWQTFVDLAKEFVGLQWDRLADIFGNIGTRFRQIFQFEKENIFVQVGEFFNTLMDWVVKWGGKAFDYIHDKFFKLIDYMLDKLKSLADYLVDSLTVAISEVPLLKAFFSEEEVEGAKKRTAGGPAVAILKAAGVAVPDPDDPFPARPERAGPPANPWRNLGEVFRLGPDVGKDRQAGIADGLKKLTQAMNFRQFVERAGALRQDIMDRIARRGMEAVTGRRFAGAGAMPGDEEGGEAVGEAGGGVPALPRMPSALDLARSRHRAAIRAVQRRSRLLFTEKVDREGEESRKLTPAEMRERRAANAAFASTQARVANAMRLFAHPGERLPLPLTGAMQRRLDAARAARGGLSPLQARIARVRARRHAGDGPNQVASGIRAMQQGLIRLGSFISPEMRAKAAQEAQKQRDQKSAADAIAAALGIPSGDFYQRIGVAVAQAVKGLGVLQ